jgi:hypothetical protein
MQKYSLLLIIPVYNEVKIIHNFLGKKAVEIYRHRKRID